MKKFVLKKIILSGVFILLSFALMAITFPLMELNPFPTKFYIDLIYLLTISVICFILPLSGQEAIQILLLLCEFLILFASVCLFKSRGDIFEWSLLTQINQLGAVKDMIKIPVWLIFVGIGFLAVYIVVATLIKTEKKLNTKKFYSWLVIFITIISLGLCSGANIITHAGLKNDYDDEDYYYTSSAFLYSSFASKSASLQMFGMFGYYVESFFRIIPAFEPEVKVVGYTYENYSSVLNGLCEDNNIIMVYGESFDIYGISKELTPTLWAMKNGVDLTSSGISEFYNVTKENGQTTISRKDFDFDGTNYTYNGTNIYETTLAEQVGLNLANYKAYENTSWSEAKALTGHYADDNYTISGLLGETYQKNYIHGNTGLFYNRNSEYLTGLFDNLYFSEDMEDFIAGTGVGGVNTLNCASLDSVTMQHCTDNPNDFNLFPTDKKFFTFFMTVTTHGGYEQNDLLKDNYKLIDTIANSEICGDMFNLYNSLDDDLKTSVREYFARTLDTEYALSYIVNYLYENNLLDKTIITFTGDHTAYANDVQEFKNKYIEEVLHKNKYELNRNVEGFIYSTNIKNDFLQENDEDRNVNEYTESVDLAPTILTLLNIEFEQDYFLGQAVINKSIANPSESVHNNVYRSFFYDEVSNDKLSSKDGQTITAKDPNYTPTEDEITQFKKDYNQIYAKFYYTMYKRQA